MKKDMMLGRKGILKTLDSSDNDKIQPQSLTTTPVVVPCWADLTTADDVFNNLPADQVGIQSDWDDDVNNDSWKKRLLTRKMTWPLKRIIWLEKNHDSTIQQSGSSSSPLVY